MRAFQTAIFGISRASAALAALIVVAMTLLILYEIVLRSLFSTSTFVLDEFVGYGVAASTFLSLGYALEHRSLIRVGLLVQRLRGLPLRVLEAVCALGGLWATTLLLYFMGLTAWRSFSRGRTSSSIAEVPSWIPETLVVVGIAVFWLQLLAYLLRQVADTPPPVPLSAGGDIQSDL